jgi:hypothetical protein
MSAFPFRYHTVFSNRGLLPYQILSYYKNPFQPGIFHIVRRSESSLWVECMNGNTQPFQHNFIATESIKYPIRGLGYLLYGSTIRPKKLKEFYVEDEYKRWYNAYIPNYVKEGDRLWITEYQGVSKIPELQRGYF